MIIINIDINILVHRLVLCVCMPALFYLQTLQMFFFIFINVKFRSRANTKVPWKINTHLQQRSSEISSNT